MLVFNKIKELFRPTSEPDRIEDIPLISCGGKLYIVIPISIPREWFKIEYLEPTTISIIQIPENIDINSLAFNEYTGFFWSSESVEYTLNKLYDYTLDEPVYLDGNLYVPIKLRQN